MFECVVAEIAAASLCAVIAEGWWLLAEMIFENRSRYEKRNRSPSV